MARAFTDEWGRVVATLIRVTGSWDLAEECAQDAFALALQRWPRDGIPDRPGAWLTTTARHRAVDRLRRDAVGAARLREVAAMSYPPEPGARDDDGAIPDDRLRLMFTCCHPALDLQARVALTLRTLAGLTAEAIRLARVLARLMPDEPEAAGLLALMLLHDARRATRLDDAGDVVTLEDQDRGRWDAGEIAEGSALLHGALRRGQPGPYQVQAAIAACHAAARTAAGTDWAEIAALYGHLERLLPSPVVRLNRVVAVAMAKGPQAGLDLVAELQSSGELAGYHLLPATRADLLRRLGRGPEAAAAYRAALALAPTDAERRFLRRRLTEAGAAW